jgi:hypothetical protein
MSVLSSQISAAHPLSVAYTSRGGSKKTVPIHCCTQPLRIELLHVSDRSRSGEIKRETVGDGLYKKVVSAARLHAQVCARFPVSGIQVILQLSTR